jgi:hypothetical protein
MGGVKVRYVARSVVVALFVSHEARRSRSHRGRDGTCTLVGSTQGWQFPHGVGTEHSMDYRLYYMSFRHASAIFYGSWSIAASSRV